MQYLEAKRVSSDFQEYTWEFVAQYTNDKIQFAFGKIGGMIYFDDVSCTEKGTDVEMVVNGNFELEDLSKWEVISWAGQTMAIEEDANSTAISNVPVNQSKSDAIYDLNGRRISEGSLRPGIYIKGGRKFVSR